MNRLPFDGLYGESEAWLPEQYIDLDKATRGTVQTDQLGGKVRDLDLGPDRGQPSRDSSPRK